MAFVKLDTGILDSTLWVERDSREVFITALLMAVPREFPSEVRQISVGSLEETGFTAPPGWYGFVPSSGPGIVRRALVEHAAGMAALEKLGSPDPESRSHDFGGRRLIRIDGGYLILNYMAYREKDHTNAERQARYRDRHRNAVTPEGNAVTLRPVTHADADAEKKKDSAAARLSGFAHFWKIWPKRVAKAAAEKAWKKLAPDIQLQARIHRAVLAQASSPEWQKDGGRFIPHPATWINGRRWEDQPTPNGGDGVPTLSAAEMAP